MTIYGYHDWDSDKEKSIIWLNPKRRPLNPIVQTFIHELGHAIFTETKEEPIRDFESFVFNRLKPSEKARLGEFIPKHYVKKQPKRRS